MSSRLFVICVAVALTFLGLGFVAGRASKPDLVVTRLVPASRDSRAVTDPPASEVVLDAAKRAEMEVEKYDTLDPDFDGRSLADALLAPPMFASARCVVVRNATSLLKKDGRNDSSITRAVLGFVKDEGLTGMIVLDADGLRADHAVSKAATAGRGHMLALRRLWDTPPP